MGVHFSREGSARQSAQQPRSELVLDPTYAFGLEAEAYALYRPRFPAQVAEALASCCKEKSIAVDIATGTGQMASPLCAHFERVIGLDHDERLIAHGANISNLEFVVGDAKQTTFDNNSVDLVTVANAIHWIRGFEFSKEMHRIIKPGGIFAAVQHRVPNFQRQISDIVYRDFLGDLLYDYHAPQLAAHNTGFDTVELPFRVIREMVFAQTEEWDLKHLIGFLNTFSAAINYRVQHEKPATDLIKRNLETYWGPPEQKAKVTFPIAVRVAQKYS